MPLQYTSGIEEHLAVRTTCGVFDVSHLGVIEVSGSEAFDLLDHVFSNDLRRIGPGRTQYTHLLSATGGVIDDCIIWWVEENQFLVIPNASNTEPIETALKERVQPDGNITIRCSPGSERAMLAIQGPTARTTIASLLGAAVSDISRFHVQRCSTPYGEVVAASTGYTGEDGMEILVSAAHAASLWDACLAHGAVPVGLAARDSLRLEAALPLHGHELSESIASRTAGLGWAVRPDGRTFPGRDAVAATSTSSTQLIGLQGTTRQFPRQGYSVFQADKVIGQISSGNYSPVLGVGIALAFVDRSVALGERVEVDMRGRGVEMEVVPLPFVPHHRTLT